MLKTQSRNCCVSSMLLILTLGVANIKAPDTGHALTKSIGYGGCMTLPYFQEIEMAKKANSPRKQSSPPLSTLAAKVLSGEKKATQADAKKVAASVLSQDEKKGQGKK
jgi:hypothetical protein